MAPAWHLQAIWHLPHLHADGNGALVARHAAEAGAAGLGCHVAYEALDPRRCEHKQHDADELPRRKHLQPSNILALSQGALDLLLPGGKCAAAGARRGGRRVGIEHVGKGCAGVLEHIDRTQRNALLQACLP